MSANSDTELDVDRLMSEIRQAAARRDFALGAEDETKPDFAPALRSPGRRTRPTRAIPDSEALPTLKSSTESEPLSATEYHVNDLLKYHDREFIFNAYRAILKREPDAQGLHNNLEMLHSGYFNKIDILASLRFSEEGKRSGVKIIGLRVPATVRSLERVPILGYVLQTGIGLLRLPTMIRNQRQFQAYALAQQGKITDHVQDLTEHIEERQSGTNQTLEAHQSAIDGLASLPMDVGNQQSQLNAVEGIVRDNVLGRVLDEHEHLRQAEMKLELMSDHLKNISLTLLQTRNELGEQVQRSRKRSQSSEELRQWDELYASFEQQFRGSALEVEERLRYYLPFIQELKRNREIVDLGPGRGDWLELLRKEGFQARGVEVNQVLAEQCRAKELDVVDGDMLNYLHGVTSDSLDVITAFHLVEHLNNLTLVRLIDEVGRTLRSGGLFMIETPSPENLVVAACNFWSDPTHLKPVYPHTLAFILRNKGFVDVGLYFLHPVEGSPFLGESSGFPQLHTWFFGPRDYAVVARKA